MLNIFFGRVTEIVQEHNGFVNKFMGDGMLAFFAVGDKYTDDALDAAASICHATDEMNRSGILSPYTGKSELAVGIGLHNGSVILGNIGSHKKLDFTVIGQPVNAASRIESLTKQFGRTVLVSSSVIEKADSRFAFEVIGKIAVRGIDKEVELYSLST